MIAIDMLKPLEMMKFVWIEINFKDCLTLYKCDRTMAYS